MKRYCVIGLGNFGFHVAKALFEEGHEVMAIDQDKDKVQAIREHSSWAILADAANQDFLADQGVGEMDAVIVSTGARTHLATLITLYLKELKVPRILVKAANEDHGRILKKVGATEIIAPEKDTALKTARALSHPNVVDFLPLGEDYTITETAPPAAFVGRSLQDLDLRRKYNVTVIAVKDVLTGHFTVLPPASTRITDSELLVLIGKEADIDRMCQTKR